MSKSKTKTRRPNQLQPVPLVFVGIVWAAVFGGCQTDGSTGPARIARQVSAPGVPLHPDRDRFIGRWQYDGETSLIIETDARANVVIRMPDSEGWDYVVNNVRWEGDVLHYDAYYYYAGPEDFTSPGNRAGSNHPYSGVRNACTLRSTDESDRLIGTIWTEDIPEPLRSDLRRE